MHQIDESDYEELIEYNKNCCIGCIPDSTYCCYLFLHEIYEIPKTFSVFIKKYNPGMAITLVGRITRSYAGDSGTEIVENQVCGGTRAGAGEMAV